MGQSVIFLPLLANMMIVLVLYYLLGVRKKRACREHTVDDSRRALHADAWPDDVMQVNNCIRNQFEQPVLFYVTGLILWALNAVNLWVLVAAWAFVLLRCCHAYVHVGSNFLPLRRRLFSFGTLVLVGLWIMAVGRWLMAWIALSSL